MREGDVCRYVRAMGDGATGRYVVRAEEGRKRRRRGEGDRRGVGVGEVGGVCGEREREGRERREGELSKEPTIARSEWRVYIRIKYIDT